MEFPAARSDSVMVIRDGQLMLWGGYTQTILGEGDRRFIVGINLPGSPKSSWGIKMGEFCISAPRSLQAASLGISKWIHP